MTLLKSTLSSSRITPAVRVGGVWEGAGIFGVLLLEAAGGGRIILEAAPLYGRLGGGVSPPVLEGLGGCGGGKSSVDLLGLGGCGGGASSSSRLVGNLGGSSSFCLDGNLGRPFAKGKTGAELTEMSGILPLVSLFPISVFAFSSRPRTFGGGKTGSFDGSKAGGSFLCASTEQVLVLEDAVRDWVNDAPDRVELIDEFDPFLVNGLKPLRGGRAGDVSDAARPGRAGGNLRPGFGDGGAARRGLSLAIRGGGRTSFLTPSGNSPPSCAIEVPNVGSGGLFVVWTRVGAGGRS